MLGYLFLFTNVLVGVSKGYCGKKNSEHINGITDGLLLQLIRVVLCVVIGGILFLISGEGLQVDKTILLISALNGLTNAAFLLSWLFAVRGGAYLFVDVCLTAGGILIPCFSGALFFDSTIKLTQYVGIVIMMAAVLVMCGYNNSITKKKLSILDILLLLCVALSNGLMGFCQKYFTYYTDNANVVCSKSYFGLLTFIFAAIIFIIATPIVCNKSKITVKQSLKKFPFKRLWAYIILIAIFLYLDTYLGTLTNEYITNTVLIYPLKFGINLILSAIMAAVMFKEKINLRSIFGMILITISIVFINVI